MLPKHQRLSRECIAHLHTTKPLRGTSTYFGITIGYVDGCQGIAVTISKKVLKGAVSRIRVKRRVRHALKDLLKNENHTFSAVVSIQKDVTTISFEDLSRELSDLLGSAIARLQRS